MSFFRDHIFVPISPLNILWTVLPQTPLMSFPANKPVECLSLLVLLLPSVLLFPGSYFEKRATAVWFPLGQHAAQVSLWSEQH